MRYLADLFRRGSGDGKMGQAGERERESEKNRYYRSVGPTKEYKAHAFINRENKCLSVTVPDGT